MANFINVTEFDVTEFEITNASEKERKFLKTMVYTLALKPTFSI
jgi:hypothetical protein